MEELLFVILIFCATFIQSLTGFGGPLLAMPLGIVLIGINTAKPVISMMAWIAAFLVAAPRYKDINWKKLLIMTSIMMVGVIVGDLFFDSVPSLTPLLIFYALVVFVIGGKRLLFPNSWTLTVPAQYGALGIAGIMQGLFISGGSFLVLYAVEQIREKNEFRATVSAVWVPLNTYLLIKYAVSGAFTASVLHLSSLIILPELAAIWLAGRLAKRLNQATFLKITYAVLAVSGIVLLINSLA